MADDDFAEWMDQVNMAVHDAVGMRARDFPDQSYRTWYDEGLTPDEAAELIFEAGI